MTLDDDEVGMIRELIYYVRLWLQEYDLQRYPWGREMAMRANAVDRFVDKKLISECTKDH